MLILDTDWCPVGAMSLSKNAYFIYKRFVLNRVSGKRRAKTIELKFDELKALLDVKWKNNSGIYKIIERSLKNMVQNGVIAGFRYNKNFANKRHYELYFEKIQIDQNKVVDEDLGILKF